MKTLRTIATFILLSALIYQPLHSQTDIVFHGQNLGNFIGQEVTFDQTLYVCGHYQNQYGGYLYLSYARLRAPEEVAMEGSSTYDSIVAAHATAVLSARCYSLRADTIRLGATITGLTATVTDSFNIRIDGTPVVANNIRPTTPPDLGDARIIVCAANLEYYCPNTDSNSYGALSDEEFTRQNIKVIKALANIHADVFAFTELQQGPTALEYLVNGLNGSTPYPYAFVSDDDNAVTNESYIKVGFVYRTDKIRPVLHLGHPYAPASNTYFNMYGNYRREEVQCFEEIETGERFVLCMNHFKSKAGGTEANHYYNSERVENAEHLTQFLNNELENNYFGDPDVLIVGDMNCGTMEEPLRFLVESGYENQLARFAPTDYSYCFDNETQYLDHAFASHTLAEQITGAKPYHLNADEIYSLYYKYSSDTTIYRYSDHDPILVGLSLHSEHSDTCQPIHLDESFAQSFGCFRPIDLGGDAYWYGYTNYECAYINGSNKGANIDWLVSPTFDLSDKSEATVRFTHALGYGNSTTWPQYCKLLVSENYNGNPTTASWTQLSIPNMPTTTWDWQENEISLAPFVGRQSITLAFKYEVQATSQNPAWEIKDFSISSTCADVPTSIQNSSIQTDKVFIYSSFGRIIIQSEEAVFIKIYDAMGREIVRTKPTNNFSQSLVPGLYIVKTNRETRKVIVY